MDAKEKTSFIYQYTRPHHNGVFLNSSLDELLKMFWECPVNVVREECLAGIARNALDEKSACWIEERIGVIVLWSYCFDRYWENLLSWYLFDSRGKNDSPFRTRALKFVISLLFEGVKQCGVTPINKELSKMIFGVIRKYPELYWAPSVPEFLEASLASVNLTLVERAVELICLAEDTSFFSRVSEISGREKQAREKAEDYRKTGNVKVRLASGKLRGFLEEAAYHLLLCKTEQGETTRYGFEKAVSSSIVRHMGVSGLGVKTELFCPETVPQGMSFSVSLSVCLQTKATNTDKSALVAVLEQSDIQVQVDGSHEVFGSEPYPTHSAKVFHDNFVATGKAVFKIAESTRKNIRLKVSFLTKDTSQMRQEVVTIIRYISRAE